MTARPSRMGRAEVARMSWRQPASRCLEAYREVAGWPVRRDPERRREREPPPRSHLIQYHSEAVDIAPLIALHGVVELLGRHVRRGSETGELGIPSSADGEKIGHRPAPACIPEIGKTKIGDLHHAVRGDHDVRRLDIAVATDPF